jgi:hypothetical protein
MGCDAEREKKKYHSITELDSCVSSEVCCNVFGNVTIISINYFDLLFLTITLAGRGNS